MWAVGVGDTASGLSLLILGRVGSATLVCCVCSLQGKAETTQSDSGF